MISVIDAAFLILTLILLWLLHRTRNRLIIVESSLNSLSRKFVAVYNSHDDMKLRTQSLEQELEQLKNRRRRSSRT